MQRKRNRLDPFVYKQNGACFITICTRERRNILGSLVGGDAHIAPQVALSSIGAVAHTYICSIPGVEKYVIMPNHIHLILRMEQVAEGTMWASSPTSVAQRVRSFNTLVTKACGQSLWQRLFYDHVIRNRDDYERVWQYIEENPAKWLEDRLFVP